MQSAELNNNTGFNFGTMFQYANALQTGIHVTVEWLSFCNINIIDMKHPKFKE